MTKREMVDRLIELDHKRARAARERRPPSEINALSEQHAVLRRRLGRLEKEANVEWHKMNPWRLKGAEQASAGYWNG